jgi:two-component system, NtrC family, sensor kinase
VLLTNSIQRKLWTNLTLVILMLVLFTVSSVRGLRSYQRTVNDLELSITNVPRRDALIASLVGLLKPFKVDFPDDSASLIERQDAADLQYRQFNQVYAEVTNRVKQFRKSWQRLPENLRPAYGYGEERSYISVFQTVEKELAELNDEKELLYDPDLRIVFISDITKTVSRLSEIIVQVPDPSNRLGERLALAQSEYQLHWRVVLSTGLISIVLFGGLMIFSHKWIFAPIGRLAVGVERISKGEYGYRLDVKTNCEISQMAKTFNSMAAKIEQDQKDKEREIQERSKQLVLSERLAGVGFLASGVAHEINNPLSFIMNAVNGVKRRLSDEALAEMSEKDRKRIFDYLDLIQSESERCEAITKKLLDFSYSGGDEKNLYDVVAVCQEVTSMVSHLSKYKDKSVTVNRSLPLHAWVNGPEIKQVVLNIIANALDASESGGTVEVAVNELPDQVEISVTDHGSGMTKEQQAKIFEPFFTTKEVGQGTGLGLSITHRIMVDHDGTLEVHSDGEGQGSTFTLRFPKKKASLRAA